jgi:hypothetical protein
MDLDLNLPPQVVFYLDLNFSPHEEEEDVQMPKAKDVEMPEAEDVEIPAAQAQSRELPDSHRFAAYIALKALGNDRKIAKADKELVATLLKTSLRTVERIWRKTREQEIKELDVDISIKRRGAEGERE